MTPKVIAYYLPQYHTTEINNKNWGPGFTEWTNVAKARPNFSNHYQPHIPRDLGFYDLAHIETLEMQISLAKKYEVDAFCFYYYWFDGKQVLEKPLKLFLGSSIDFKFCICWANENWSKNWDGGNKEVILEQTYGDNFERNFIKSVKDILLDNRYLRIDGKPLLQIYRIGLLPNPKLSIKKFRIAAAEEGVGELLIVLVDFNVGLEKAISYGADYLSEFPPHGFITEKTLCSLPAPNELINKEFCGRIVDYNHCMELSLSKWTEKTNKLPVMRGIIPSWDNTPRRQNDGTVFIHASPQKFYHWLKFLLSYSSEFKSPCVFINAWNEWGEGAHLEPDLKYKTNYLEQIPLAKKNYKSYQKETKYFLSYIDTVSEQGVQEISRHTKPKVIKFSDFIKNRLMQYPRLYIMVQKFYRMIKNL